MRLLGSEFLLRVGITLLKHVCEVNSFSKGVPSCGGLRRSNSKALSQNSEEVEHRAAVEKEAVVSVVRVLSNVFCLSLSLDLKDVDLVSAEADGRARSVFDVLVNQAVLG